MHKLPSAGKNWLEIHQRVSKVCFKSLDSVFKNQLYSVNFHPIFDFSFAFVKKLTIYFIGRFTFEKNEEHYGETKMNKNGNTRNSHILRQKVISRDSKIQSEFKYVIGLSQKIVFLRGNSHFYTVLA